MLRLYWDNGKETGNYCNSLGFRDYDLGFRGLGFRVNIARANGKDNGNHF